MPSDRYLRQMVYRMEVPQWGLWDYWRVTKKYIKQFREFVTIFSYLGFVAVAYSSSCDSSCSINSSVV